MTRSSFCRPCRHHTQFRIAVAERLPLEIAQIPVVIVVTMWAAPAILIFVVLTVDHVVSP